MSVVSFRAKSATILSAVALTATTWLAIPAASAQSGSWLDTDDRAEVVASYNAEFSGSLPAVDWTGSFDSCDAGTSSHAVRDATVERINWYRSLAGVPPTVTENSTLTDQAQAAALIMGAEGRLSHGPGTDWQCYTDSGGQAAGESNLALGSNGVYSVDRYMLDTGANNTAAGHRNWILNPSLENVGIGNVDGQSWRQRANALHVFDNAFGTWTTRSSDKTIAWPPAGFVPGEIVYPRWSFSIGDETGNFANATVIVTADGQTLPTSIEHAPSFSKWSRPNGQLVWTVGDIDELPDRDTEYTVEISNVTVGDQTRSFAYSVTVIGCDPNQTAVLLGCDIEPVDPVDPDTPAEPEDPANPEDPVDPGEPTDPDEPMVPDEATGPTVPEAKGTIAEAQSIDDIINAVDYQGGDSTDGAVLRLYRAIFDREPDASGAKYWLDVENGYGVLEIAGFMSGSQEWSNTYRGTSDAQFVEQVYRNVLGRPSEPTGYAYWLDLLETGQLNRPQLVYYVSANDEFTSRFPYEP